MSSRPIHVLKVVKSTAGVGQGTRWVVEGLHARFRLTVACLSEGGAELAAYLNRYPGVRAFHLPMERYQVDPLGDARLTWRLARLIRSEQFDLIHAHASKPGMVARLAAVGTGIPVIYQPACFAFHDGVARNKAAAIAAVERVAARLLTSSILCACDDERELARRWRVGNPQQLVTIYTGIDTEPFDQVADRRSLRAALGIPPDAVLVGSVGRLDLQKAPDDLVRAASRVHAKLPDVHFVWIGSGTLEAQARTLVHEYQLEAVFHFAGERRDIPAVLQALDLFVLPSHWEGFSLSVLEAMAARLPVVATQVMGAAEAVRDGESGLLVPIGSPAHLADAIERLARDPALARRYGEAGRQRIEQRFTRRQMLNYIAALYEATSLSGQSPGTHLPPDAGRPLG